MNDDRDVDARFREIIGTEFGNVPADGLDPLRAPDDFNFTAAMDHAEPEPGWAGRYEPEPLPPMRRPGLRVLGATVLMVAGVLVALLSLFGAQFERTVTWLGIVAALVGLALLLSAAPRGRRAPWDDGARI